MYLDKVDIKKTYSKQDFLKSTSQIIVQIANERIKESGKFSFVLSGGSTPKCIFRDLAENHQDCIDWSRVDFFWLDERCVDPSHEDSNYKLAYDHLISKLKSVGSIHRIHGEKYPIKAAEDYELDIVNYFLEEKIKFDFILLGMGNDGHVASLFPDSEELKIIDKIVLSTDKKHNGHSRVTLSSSTINHSKFNLLILSGKMKYEKYKENNLPKDLIRFDKVIVLL